MVFAFVITTGVLLGIEPGISRNSYRAKALHLRSPTGL
jgi:hypothetical protein